MLPYVVRTCKGGDFSYNLFHQSAHFVHQVIKNLIENGSTAKTRSVAKPITSAALREVLEKMELVVINETFLAILKNIYHRFVT